MKPKKHPIMIAWEKWIESPEGKCCIEPLPTASIYQINRLHRAFNAGIAWAEKGDSK
jgi:hypothetical protein